MFVFPKAACLEACKKCNGRLPKENGRRPMDAYSYDLKAGYAISDAL